MLPAFAVACLYSRDRFLPSFAGLLMRIRLAFFLLLCLPAPGLPAWAQTSAAQVTANATELSEAKPIDATAVADALKAHKHLIVFDVREREEYRVSHLPTARHLVPEADVETVVRRVGRRGAGAIVVFYCTIGGRSAVIAEAAADALKSQGVLDVRVLENGIIGWSNAGLPLVDRRGATQFVHPFDAEMAKHLSHPEMARFQAR